MAPTRGRGGYRSGSPRGAARPGTGGQPGGRRRPRRSAKSGRTPFYWIGGIAVSLLISAIVAFGRKSGDDTDVKGQMMDIVATYEGYGANRDYYARLVDRAHPSVFEATYAVGRRRNQFSAQQYYEQMVVKMVELARSDGRTEIASQIMGSHR
jgi:hypothetical protein